MNVVYGMVEALAENWGPKTVQLCIKSVFAHFCVVEESNDVRKFPTPPVFR